MEFYHVFYGRLSDGPTQKKANRAAIVRLREKHERTGNKTVLRAVSGFLAKSFSPGLHRSFRLATIYSLHFGIVRKFLLHTSKHNPVCRLDGVKNSVVHCVSRKGALCTELAGFGVCAFFALTSPFILCGTLVVRRGNPS